MTPTLRPGRKGAGQLAVAALGVALVLGVAGCSVKPRSMLSSAGLERTIAAQLATSYRIAPPRVHCPASVTDRVGARLTCTTRVDGQSLGVSVRVTGLHGRAQLRPNSAVVVISDARAQLVASLDAGKLGPHVVVTCPGPALLVIKPGRSYYCTATVGQVERRVVVTVTNLAGLLSYKVLPYRANTSGEAA